MKFLVMAVLAASLLTSGARADVFSDEQQQNANGVFTAWSMVVQTIAPCKKATKEATDNARSKCVHYASVHGLSSQACMTTPAQILSKKTGWTSMASIGIGAMIQKPYCDVTVLLDLNQ